MEYYMDMYQGGFRTTEAYWMYLGFACLLLAGLLSASIVGWKVDGNELARATPGNHVESETLYVTVADSLSVELKSLEYCGLFLAGLGVLVCYAMGAK